MFEEGIAGNGWHARIQLVCGLRWILCLSEAASDMSFVVIGGVVVKPPVEAILDDNDRGLVSIRSSVSLELFCINISL